MNIFQNATTIQTTGGVLTQSGYETIIKTICDVFICTPDEIYNIEPLQKGLSNVILSFEYNGGKYVYRHPGLGSDDLIDRGRESLVQTFVDDIGVDTTLVAMSARHGWRISRFINARKFDYHDLNDVVRAIRLIRRLHDTSVKVRWEFDVIEKAEAIKDLTPIEKYGVKSGLFDNFDIIKERCYKLYEKTKSDSIRKCLSHGDCRDENFLINDKEIHLIDWEYSGYSDPGFDIGTYICGGNHTEKEVDQILFIYFGKEPTIEERCHFYAYIAITGFFYMHWTMYKEAHGQVIGYLKGLWHGYATKYSEIACNLYKIKGDEM